MGRSGKAPHPDIVRVSLRRGGDRFVQLEIFLDEGRRMLEQTDHVFRNQDLPVAVARRADADGRNRNRFRDALRQRFRDAFEDATKGAGVGDRLGVAFDRRPLTALTPHDAITALHVDRLGQETDMPHDRDAVVDQKGDGLFHANAAFQFHGGASGFLDDADGVTVRDLRTFLVAAERHIDGDQRPFGAAHHRLAVKDHVIHRDAQRRVHTVDRHGDGIADQEQIDVRVEEMRHGRGVRGETDDGLARFSLLNFGNGESKNLVVAGHTHLPRARGALLTVQDGYQGHFAGRSTSPDRQRRLRLSNNRRLGKCK